MMKQPLNNPKPFMGKSFIHHPHWQNQPLRLTREEIKNPLLVLDEFFQSYHLKDTREILWNWLSAALTGQDSISGSPLDRDNHLFFYEKLEPLIEVAFVLKNKMHKRRQRKEKKRFKKDLNKSL